MKRCLLSAATLFSLALAPTAARAVDGSWVVDAGGNWSNSANWVGGIAATGANAAAYFTNTLTASRTVTNDLPGSVAIGRLIFAPGAANAWTVTGNPLALTLTTAGAATVTVSSGSATISAAITGGTNLIKLGNGTLSLRGTNTYVGGTTISAGLLSVVADENLGATNSNVSLNGGVLQIAASFTNRAPRADNVAAASTLDVMPGVTYQLNNGTLTGSQTLTKTNTGTFVINQTSGNSGYTGTLTINGGTVLLSGSVGDGALRGNVTINNGGTLKLGYNNPIINSCIPTINAGGVFDMNGFSDLIAFVSGAGTITNVGGLSLDLGAANNTFSGTISGSGGLGVRGGASLAGVQILSGSNTFAGPVTLLGGTLGISAYENLGAAGKAILFTGGTLRVTGTVITNLDTYAVNWTNFSGAFDIATAANTFTVTNAIGGVGFLTKLGTGTLALAGANVYTGTTTVAGGTLDLGATASLSSRLVQVQFGATLVVRNVDALPAVPTLYVSQAGGFGRVDLSAVTGLTVNTFVVDGLTQAAGTWGATGSGATFTNDNIFTGAGILSVLGGFTAVDAGGSWGVNASGNWADTNNWIDGMVAYGTNATAYFTNALTADRIANNGFTTLPIGNLVFGSPTNNWTITNNTIRLDVLAGTPTITVATNTATVASVLTGVQGLTKDGAGTLVVTASGSYTGATTVAAGTLQYAGNGSPYLAGTLPGQLTVNSNALLVFSKSDTFGTHTSYPNSLVTIEAGGRAQNANNGFTTLRNLTLSGGELRANGGNGTTWPAYQLKGTVTVSGTSASLISAFGNTNGNHQIHLGNNITNGITEFAVADVTGSDADDLVVAAGFSDGRAPSSPNPLVPSGFVKTGPGTMRLSGSSVNKGASTLASGTVVLAGSATLNGPLLLASGTTVVCESGPGLLGEYYNLTAGPAAANFANPTLLSTHLSGLNPSLLYNMAMTITNFDFAANGANMPVNYLSSNVNFEARWVGKFIAPVSGSYYFGMNSDDGSYLWIDGTNVIVKNGAGGFGTNTITLDAGLHDIAFGLFQGSGAYGLYCDLSIAGGPTNRLSNTNLLSGPGISALDGGAGATIFLSNAVLTVAQSNDTTFTGTLTSIGNGTLRKLGAGTLALASTNSLSGLSLGAGRISISSDEQIGGAASAITFDGGILRITGTALTNLDSHAVNWSSFNGGFDIASSVNQFLVTNALSGPGSFTKSGPGALFLTGNNTFTGTTTAAGGYLILAPSVSNAISTLNVSGGPTGALVVIAGATSLAASNVVVGTSAGDRSALVISNNLTSSRLLVGNNSTAAGAVVHNAGNVTIGPTLNGSDVLSLGLGGGGYGYYQMNGGSLTAGQIAPGGNSTNVSGVFDLYNGIVNVSAGSGWIVLGWQKANAALNIFDGAITNTPANNDVTLGFAANGGSFGMINLIGSNALLNALGGGATRSLNMMNSTGNLLSAVNLNGGRLIANRIRQNANGLTVLGFNGGTLQANGGITQTQFLQGLTSAFVYANGATIDSSNAVITIAQPLLAPASSGVASIGVTSGGAGYVGPPVVVLSGGGGTGATAIAQVNLTLGHPAFGQITNFLVTSAGSGYSSAPSVTLVGGGALLAATPGLPVLSANVSGGLTKRGVGQLTLAATNTYGGVTTIENGSLVMGNAAALSTGALRMASTSAALGAAFTIDQAFLNGLGSRLDPTSTAGSLLLASNNASVLNFEAAGLTNWTLGAAAGTVTNSGDITTSATNLYLGAGLGTLVYLPSIGTGTNVFIGPYGIKPTVVLAGTNAAYGSTIELVNGTLKAGASNAFGSAAATVNVVPGTTLDLGGQNLGAVQVKVQGSGASNNGAIVSFGADQTLALQDVTLTGDALVGGGNRWDIRTAIVSPSLDLAGFTLTKTNANYVALVNADVTDGGIVVAQGTLSLESGTSLDSASGTIAVNSGGTLQLWSLLGGFTWPLTLNGGTLVSGQGVNTPGCAIDLAGPTNFVSALAGASLVPGGLISGTGTLVKVGAGIVRLNAAQAYTGRTIVNSGLLELASADLDNGTLPATSDLLIQGAGTVQLDLPTALAGTNGKAITLASGGILTTTNNVSARLFGPVTFAGGTLAGGNPDALNGNWLIDTSPVVTSNSFVTAPRAQLNGAIDFNVSNGAVLNVSGTFEDPALGTGGVTGSLVKTGGGTLLIAATNNYAGATEISAGTLRLGQGLPVTGAALWLDAADLATIATDSSNLVSQWSDKSGNGRHAAQATQANRPRLTNNAAVSSLPVVRFSGGAQSMPVDLAFFSQTSYSIFAVEGRLVNSNNLYFLGMNGTGTNNNQLHVGYRSATSFTLAQYANDLDAAAGAFTGQTFRLWNGNLDTSVGRSIWLNGTSVATGTNKIPFNVPTTPGAVGRGNNNPYNGDLSEIVVFPRALATTERQAMESYLSNKWLNAGATIGMNYLPIATPLRIAGGATLDLGGIGQTVGSLSDLGGTGGTVTNSWISSGVLSVGNDNGTASFSGTLAGLLSLSKVGTGTQVLHGVNTFTGPTALNAGTLVVHGSLSTGQIDIASGATLGGTGSVAGLVLNLGGTIAPGSSPGRLTISDALIQLGAASIDLEIAGTNAGTYDVLAAGSIQLDGTLNVATNGYAPAAGDSFTVITSSNAITGAFAATNLPALGTGLGWVVQQLANTVVLSVTGAPPASGYDLVALGIAIPAQRGYQDDPDADGYANLLEYVTGGNLTNADAVARMAGARTNGLLVLQFTRDTNSTDATIIVEGSDSAANGATWLGIATNIGGNWGAGTNVVESGTSTPVNVTAFDDTTGTNRFLRLRVTRP